MAKWSRKEAAFMAEALALAARGRGRVEPNPMVGCVLVRNGRVVGKGFHRRFGGPHAEVEALHDAGSLARGATAYVTLEPCCHFGKTPPCTDAMIRAGVTRIAAAMVDVNPLVSGKGMAALRRAGVECGVGLLGAAARNLNAPFVTYHLHGRPWVMLKWAQSIDGKIATRTGDSKWITSLESRREAHALRSRVDAVVVGVGTVIADDPDLTARLVAPLRVATRVVLDPNLRTPTTARLVRSARYVPTVIVTRRTNRVPDKARRLYRAGCEILAVPVQGRALDLHSLLQALRDRGMTNVMVEGGGRTLGAFLEAGLADEARVFVAPILVGGEAAPGPLRNLGPATLGRRQGVAVVSQARFGSDSCYTILFNRPT